MSPPERPALTTDLVYRHGPGCSPWPVSACWMALLPRRFRCSGRRRPCAPGRLAAGDMGSCDCKHRYPAEVAPESAALPPAPSPLSVVRLRVSVDEGSPRCRPVLRRGQTPDNVSPPQQKPLGVYGEDTQKWTPDGGSACVLPDFSIAQRDAACRRSPMPTVGAVWRDWSVGRRGARYPSMLRARAAGRCRLDRA